MYNNLGITDQNAFAEVNEAEVILVQIPIHF